MDALILSNINGVSRKQIDSSLNYWLACAVNYLSKGLNIRLNEEHKEFFTAETIQICGMCVMEGNSKILVKKNNTNIIFYNTRTRILSYNLVNISVKPNSYPQFEGRKLRGFYIFITPLPLIFHLPCFS